MILLDNVLDYLSEHKVTFELVNTDSHNRKTPIGFCPLNDLNHNCVTWAKDITNLHDGELRKYKNICIICKPFSDYKKFQDVMFIFVGDPFSVYFSVLDYILNESNGRVSEGYIIGGSSIVETDRIGKGSIIGENCYISKDVTIGENVTIKNNVSIECKTIIGDRTVIYSGAILGVKGYGYFTDIQGNRKRVPHIGGIIIGSNVEIGACTCIAQGCLGNTCIGDNVKIDNLIHIAHNVKIGKGSYIVAQTLLGGSAEIGENVWVAPCSAIKNQVKVGKNSIIGLGAVVIKNVEENKVMVGVPARVLDNKS